MANLRMAKTEENSCFTCKYNCIKLILAKFENGAPCTGCCTHSDSGIYYNSIKMTCDLWEDKSHEL